MKYEPLTRPRDELDDRVEVITSALEAMPVEIVNVISDALMMVEKQGPWAYLGATLIAWDGDSDFLVHLRLRRWLDSYAKDKAVLRKLRQANGAPWRQLRAALLAA